MIKYAFALILICAFTACQEPAKTGTSTTETAASGTKHVPKEMLISPGDGIGQIKIGSSTDSVVKILGKPDAGDAAMGASLMVWYAGHDSTGYRTSVYARRNMGSPDGNIAKVKAIRITSPDFNTTDMIHTGSILDSIKTHYTLNSQSSRSDKNHTVYDDNRAGIAFEIDKQQKCSAIIVFAKGDSSVAYLDLSL